MSAACRNVVVLGATGSIGMSAAKVARAMPDRVRLVGLSGNTNTERLLETAREFRPEAVCCGSETEAARVRESLPDMQVGHGDEGLLELATLPAADIVLVAIVGTAGLAPALAALEHGKDLAVASKEILVMAGGIVMETAHRHGARILPVDSEHNAIFQCLEGKPTESVRRLVLTCSGGPFRATPAGEFSRITPADALRHPTWNMGRKITIDSATLFNKGLEMIEAHWLFGVEMERIDVVVHPQSIVHSMVEFVDGSVLAQLSATDMAFPIQFALTYPDRMPGVTERLDLAALGRLEFEAPREKDFPALALARRAGKEGGVLPAVFNAANEGAVEAFLEGKIRFPDIWRLVREAMDAAPAIARPALADILAADAQAREKIGGAAG